MSAANRYSAISPSQYSGAETNTSAVPIVARSSRERRRSAETIPIGRPIASQMTAAPTVSDSVAGSRSAIRLLTDAPL